jgi:lipoprotein-anchoring transpeptidase ErfK/SrfK
MSGRRAAVGLAVVGALVAACQNGVNRQALTPGQQAVAPEQDAIATLEVTPKDGQRGVLPTDPVTVSSVGGEVTDVVVVGSSVPPVRGSLNDGTWTSEQGQQLVAGGEYHVYALVKDKRDQIQSVVTTFRVLDKAHTLTTRMAPLNGETVGVGMPIMVIFNAKVSDRAAVERRLSVEASPAPVEGAWHWFTDREVHYRPMTYWPAHSEVTVRLKLSGVDAGDGVRGIRDRTLHFKVGAAHLSLVDSVKHNMVVKSDGVVVRTMKVSTGRPKYPSQSGVHLVISRSNPEIMDSATVGIPRNSPDGYYEKVPWSTRISYSGEFVHAAAWSVRDQGVRNVSHGCVNISPTEAEWFYHFSRRGDVVDIINTPKRYPHGAGFQEWTYSWDDWKAGSALAG